MKISHRPDGDGRMHFPGGGKPLLNITPQILYVGTLRKNPTWQETEHFHSFCEIIFVTDGYGSLNVNGKSKSLSRGDIIVYNPGCPHFEQSDKTFPMEILFMALDGFTLWDMSPNTLIDGSNYALFPSGELYSLYYSHFKTLSLEYRNKNPFFREICISSAQIIIYHILRLQSIITEQPVPLSSPVKKAVSFIEDNFTRDISLDELADVCFLTKYYLAHSFKKLTGKTVGEYIRTLRIEKAKKLLTETELSVSSIAYECGFWEVNYFHRIFKKEVGFTPGQYRLRYR